MHNHNHCCCEHEVKWCSHCQKVYCTKCGREWGNYAGYYYNNWSGMNQYYPTLTRATMGNINTFKDGLATQCSHKG